MIFAKGNLKPTTSQKKEIRERADESFTRLASDDFNKPDPSLNWFVSKTKEMYMYGETTDFQNTVLLKCKYVRPHKDEWVGNWPLEEGQRSANIFWVLDIKPGRYLELYIDDNRHFMTNGDWVIFDDTKVTHSVFSDTQWRGAVCQLTDSSLYKKDKYDAYPYKEIDHY